MSANEYTLTQIVNDRNRELRKVIGERDRLLAVCEAFISADQGTREEAAAINQMDDLLLELRDEKRPNYDTV